ncbi:hypothetical protein NDU88_006873, partial [Pleurodeles waltl]
SPSALRTPPAHTPVPRGAGTPGGSNAQRWHVGLSRISLKSTAALHRRTIL